MKKRIDNKHLHEAWSEHFSMIHILSQLSHSSIINIGEIQFKENSSESNPYLYYFPDGIKSAIGVIEKVFKHKKPKEARVSWNHEMDNATLTIITWL